MSNECCPVIGFDFFPASIQPNGNILGFSRVVPLKSHWVLDTLSALIFIADAAGQGNVAISGVFLVPPSQPQDKGLLGIIQNAIAIPVDTSSFPFSGNITLGAGPARVTRFVYQGRGLVIPATWSLALSYIANSGVFASGAFGLCNFSYQQIEES